GSQISDRQILRVQISLVELNREADPLQSHQEQLEELAQRAEDLGFDDVALLSRYTSIRKQFMGSADSLEAEEDAQAFFKPLIEQTQTLIDEQTSAGYLYEVSDSLLTLSTIQNRSSQFAASLQTLERALTIEETLRRPARMMAAHANLAYLKVAWNEVEPDVSGERLKEAEGHVAQVRDLADREGLTSREYFNWYILALIENQRENTALSCSHLEKALPAWSKNYMTGLDPEKLADELNCAF
ncbi:MAG: hypothetical protein AAFQ24_06085, partial [Pseudomonadota bacterium]